MMIASGLSSSANEAIAVARESRALVEEVHDEVTVLGHQNHSAGSFEQLAPRPNIVFVLADDEGNPRPVRMQAAAANPAPERASDNDG